MFGMNDLIIVQYVSNECLLTEFNFLCTYIVLGLLFLMHLGICNIAKISFKNLFTSVIETSLTFLLLIF